MLLLIRIPPFNIEGQFSSEVLFFKLVLSAMLCSFVEF